MSLGLLVASENANKHTDTQTRFMFYKYRLDFAQKLSLFKHDLYMSIPGHLVSGGSVVGHPRPLSFSPCVSTSTATKPRDDMKEIM